MSQSNGLLQWLVCQFVSNVVLKLFGILLIQLFFHISPLSCQGEIMEQSSFKDLRFF